MSDRVLKGGSDVSLVTDVITSIDKSSSLSEEVTLRTLVLLHEAAPRR